MNDTTATPPPRSSLLALVAVILSGAAVLVCALVGIAYMAGWIGQPEHPVVAAVASGKATPAADGTADLALAPGEVLVEPATVPARAPEPLFPKYGAPQAPLPAPPESAATRPTGVPRSPYLPGPAPKPAPAPSSTPPVVAPVDSPRPRDEPREPRYEPRYAEEVRGREEPRERRGSRRFCENCAVVTAVSQYIDEWEVHLRFTDGSRRRIHYDRPPPVARGDRVYFENGRLFLE